MLDRVHVVILSQPDDDRVVVGVRLAERVRRASVLAGVSAERVHVVTTIAELASTRTKLAGEVVAIRGTTQVVMTSFVEKLLAVAGTAIAYDTTRGEYADAMRLDSDAMIDGLWRALAGDFAAGDRRFAESVSTKLEILDTDRHPVRSAEEHAAASKWIYQFVNKPLLDAPVTKYFYRPIARPFTRLFTRLPLTPNMITIASIIIGQIGCVIAARPTYYEHLIGIFTMAFLSGILDNVDGEVSRLRLQSTKIGAWLDAVGDDLLRLSLLVALGVHCAPAYPDLPIMVITYISTGATVLAMGGMYWYTLGVVGSPNIQHFNKAMASEGERTALQKLVDGLVKAGAMMARRDFVDVATFVLAVCGMPIIAVVMLAIGNVAGLIAIVPALIRAMRADQPA